MKTKQLESFPAGVNPLHIDRFSMGSQVTSNVMVTMADHDSEVVVVCHIPSGQRIEVDFRPTPNQRVLDDIKRLNALRDASSRKEVF